MQIISSQVPIYYGRIRLAKGESKKARSMVDDNNAMLHFRITFSTPQKLSSFVASNLTWERGCGLRMA